MESRNIVKTYICILYGHLPKKEDTLTAYLQKDSRASVVTVSDTPFPNSQKIVTSYRELAYENDLTVAEVELQSGRTHQIRAHFAHIGNPVVGDGKYGINAANKTLGASMQALWAYKVEFRFPDDHGPFGYLSGKIFKSKPDFAGLKNVPVHLPTNI
jgi:23S rRNA pseudouridine955/2504/2580 synthase